MFPLGRFYDSRDGKFHYFFNQKSCQPGSKDGKVWTVQEWLDEFSIRETEDMTKSWNRLVSGIVKITHRMKLDELNQCGGGAQEFELRAGTENVARIIGFGKACEFSAEQFNKDRATV